ncbi:MAG: hypothetical protein R3C28_09535, partial [Pirellulaceae bacterium]
MNRSRGAVVFDNGKLIAATRLSRPFCQDKEMLITITGSAKVSIYGTPKDEIRLQLSGIESADSCCRYLPNDFRDLGIIGGKILLFLDESSQTFSVRTEYRVPERLDTSQL